ncbi:MAG: patatin-like phospholipase family protein [Alphaproteobacteria bacterium]|nr:patatin-like phospholipase family protein [Alphaproteobacteria bacterium]
MVDRNPPSPAEIERWFLADPGVPPRTFELALVLGGTVSAGAYTAGALDFLSEALDSWTQLRDANNSAAPRHNVVLRVITGTSGGGVCAAIAGRALAYEFDPIARSTPVGSQATGNPFYDTWIKTLTLDRFLDISDIGRDVTSLLNGAAIDLGARNIVEFTGKGPKRRSWIAAPLRIILTLTNLRGIPFRLDFEGGRSESYVDHADFIRYALVYPNQPIIEFRPDELTLGFDGERLPQASSWEEFSLFARATAAFPAGFPPRALSRPTAHYRWRAVLRAPLDPAAAVSGEPPYSVLLPDWEALVPDGAGDVPDDYHFLAIDGGTTDNEPLELARTALCGIRGSNPRDPHEANRAVLLIDPFAGKNQLGPDGLTSFANLLGALGSALTQQTRYDSRDLVLAADQHVFSRFMLTPQLGTKLGEQAIASAGLGAFIGFACSDFMRYDYLLGRKNCQDFLRNSFLLANDNQLFAAWTDEQREAFRSPGNYLPIVPLVGPCAIEETLDPWPKGKLDPERYRDPIERRFRAIFEAEISGGPLRAVLGWIAAHAAQASFTDYVINQMKQYLVAAGLA